MTMQNAKFKAEFKKRTYAFVLRLIKFIDTLPRDSVCDIMGRQLLRSGTSILANYVEAGAASSKKDFINFLTTRLNRPMSLRFGWHSFGTPIKATILKSKRF